MQHQAGDFAGRKGLSIHWQAWMPAAADMPAACVLISHGLGEHGGRYQQIIGFRREGDKSVAIKGCCVPGSSPSVECLSESLRTNADMRG
jgi:hypothetical protein